MSSVTEAGNKPWFLEECPAVFTTAYSSGQGGTDHDIVSDTPPSRTAIHVSFGKDNDRFTPWLHKTSHGNIGSSAPSGRGLRARSRSKVRTPCPSSKMRHLLFASPDLTWRDVMHITVLGSRSYAIPSNTNVIRNAAGFNGTILTLAAQLHRPSLSLSLQSVVGTVSA